MLKLYPPFLSHVAKLTVVIVLFAFLNKPVFAAVDYNGNIIGRRGTVVLNNKSSNSYIQNLTSHTINFDGLLDQPFGNNTAGPLGTNYINYSIAGGSRVTDQCNGLVIQSDGKIVLGGVSFDGQNNHFSAARYLTNGQLDASFGTNGIVSVPNIIPGGSNDVCNALALQSDGKIVLGGTTTFDYMNYYFAAVRLTPTGTLDTSFGGQVSQAGTMYISTSISGEIETNDKCFTLAIQTNGNIVMGGSTDGGEEHNKYFAAARLTSTGILDQTFGAVDTPQAGTMYIDMSISGADSSPYDQCNAIAVQSDGKIVMGGWSYLDDYHFAAARLTSIGILDTAFGNHTPTNGTMYISGSISGSGDFCQALVIQPNGKIIMSGFTEDNPSYYFAAAQLTTTGILDITFGNHTPTNGTMHIKTSVSGRVISNDHCYGMALQPDGKILLSGVTESPTDGINYFAVARLLVGGTLDTTFGGTNSSPAGAMCINSSISGFTPANDRCNAIAIQSDGKIVLGGYTVYEVYPSITYNYFAVARLINPMNLKTYQATYAKVGAGLYV